MALSPKISSLMDALSCVTHNGGQHSIIQIVETDKSAQLNKINLTANNGDWFCFSPDEGRKCKYLKKGCNIVVMSPLLVINQKVSHHCACDAVVLVMEENGLKVVYIDLKSGNPVGYSPQFKSTRQFVRYLIGLYNEFNNENLKITDERYVIFFGGQKNLLNKTTTVPKHRASQSKPDEAYKRMIENNGTVFLRELLA